MTEIQVPVQLWDKMVNSLIGCKLDMAFGEQAKFMSEIMIAAQAAKDKILKEAEKVEA